MKTENNQLIFFVNGRKIFEKNPNPEWTLIYYLRNKLRLCGTKMACGEGSCSSCTCMLSYYNAETDKITNMAVNSCLMPLCSLHGMAITTVEGIGNVRNGLHPVQERMAKSHATQCGFCTPGFVMSMYTLLRNNPNPTEQDVENSIMGNLCRCTGYRPILQGLKTFCKTPGIKENGCCNGQSNQVYCCRSERNDLKEVGDILFDESDFQPYSPIKDAIFPPELKVNHSSYNDNLEFNHEGKFWFRPVSIDQALQLLKEHPSAKIIAGNTELATELRFEHISYPVYIQINKIPELNLIENSDTKFIVGGVVSIEKIYKFCHSQNSQSNGANNGKILTTLGNYLDKFASEQIRNVATVGGNLVTKRKISDLKTFLLCADAEITLLTQSGKKSLKIKEFLEKVLVENEIILSLSIPHNKENEFIWAYKQSKRLDNDISIVNTAMKLQISSTNDIIEDAKLVFGGMNSSVKIAESATLYLIGKRFDRELVQKIPSLLEQDLPLPSDSEGGMIAYKQSLLHSLFLKCYLQVSVWLKKDVSEDELCAIRSCYRGTTKGSQMFQIMPKDQAFEDLVGRPIPHLASLQHATGEAIYLDDIPNYENELKGALVRSTIASGKIISVNTDEALALEGVVKYYSYKDIPNNIYGAVLQDTEVFASKNVLFYGQIIGFIVAKTEKIARIAATKVKIEYEETIPILTIEDAIKNNSFMEYPKELGGNKILDGNVEEAFKNSDQVAEGEIKIGGQEHMYMETQRCLAHYKENDEIEIFSSTQSPTELQKMVANCLQIPFNRVILVIRRVGGGFGGKECVSGHFAIMAALASYDLRTPVRLVLNRKEDMEITGERHPFFAKYKVGFKNDGQILGIKANIMSNGGCTLDWSSFILERALMSIDNSYYIPNWYIEGKVCKTNLQSFTAFRAFGGPQGSFIGGNIIEKVAATLNMDPVEIREKHLYKEGDKRPYGLRNINCTLRRCWDECILNSNYNERKLAVENFNKENKWKKRGITIVPVSHPIIPDPKSQGYAMILIYRDGSVALNHGGIEIGQGINTKMIQVAGRALNIPINKIYTGEMRTDKIPNANPTAGSITADINGPAIINACEQLLERLEPIKKANLNGNWEEWVLAAYENKICLSAIGHYKSDLKFDILEQTGNFPVYITFGVACTEVEIDCLTGENSVLRTDCVVDCGESLNPAIDIGQIEGAFLQGLGLFTLEELKYSPKGKLLTNSPETYKIPTLSNIPKEFYVSLLRGSKNVSAVYSSKAIGEPPLFLGASVYFAIKEAIKEFRKENNLSINFQLNSPATVDKIRMACCKENINEIDPNKIEHWAVDV